MNLIFPLCWILLLNLFFSFYMCVCVCYIKNYSPWTLTTISPPSITSPLFSCNITFAPFAVSQTSQAPHPGQWVPWLKLTEIFQGLMSISPLQSLIKNKKGIESPGGLGDTCVRPSVWFLALQSPQAPPENIGRFWSFFGVVCLFGGTPSRFQSLLLVQGLLITRLRGLYVVPGIEPRLAMSKISALPAAISLASISGLFCFD